MDKPGSSADDPRRPIAGGDDRTYVWPLLSEIEVDQMFEQRMRQTGRHFRQFNIRVSFKMTTTGFEKTIQKLERVINADAVVVRLIRNAVIRSLVANIRSRFLVSMERAVEMHVLEQDGKAVTNSPKTRMRDLKLKASIQGNLERLAEAQLKSDYATADRIRDRVNKQFEQLWARLQQGPNGVAYPSHKLSTLAGNRFRRQMFTVLALFTDAMNVYAEKTASGIAIGVGPRAALESVTTPSATKALTGRESSSRYKVMWRQLEFGTGALRNAQKDRLNKWAVPKDEWWYGPKNTKAGLLLKGTAPMNFLTDGSGAMYPEDQVRMFEEITRALDELLTT